MKFIIAVVPHQKLDKLKERLAEIEVTRMTILDARGYGRQKGHREIFRGQEVHISFTHKLEVQIAVNEEFLQKTVDVIHEVCFSGKPGDGKVFVLPLEQVYRISTRESGEGAV